MKTSRLLIAVATAALVTVGCGKQQTSNAPVTPGQPLNPAGKPVDAASSGSVTGRVKLDGAPPPMKQINMAGVPNCAKQHASPAMTEDVVTGENGTLQNVVVYLKGDFSQYSFPRSTTPVKLEQIGCRFAPHVIAIMTGEPLEVTNADVVTHNTHPTPQQNRAWTETQPPGAQPVRQSFGAEEVAIPVKCNLHPWMKAYVAVLGSPYFQVTRADGTFDLSSVPPGTYTLVAWHELYGKREQIITINPRQKQTATITFSVPAHS